MEYSFTKSITSIIFSILIIIIIILALNKSKSISYIKVSDEIKNVKIGDTIIVESNKEGLIIKPYYKGYKVYSEESLFIVN